MEISEMAKIFKALSNEKRLQLFKNIYEWQVGEMKPEETLQCCDGIKKTFTKACGCMDLSRSTVSHHLKELQNAGLITCIREGQTLVCKVNQDVIDAVKTFID
ncbi:MAG: helix-turn-helix transcriptional regulator [Desulfobacterales bacterium]|nr:helix-turn-helix transcriptional regulator [Desulfobacterales bacterium]MCP4159056.1 helix-turn-helix transcriptional regulator [Deltaproteobacteria bacterium]